MIRMVLVAPSSSLSVYVKEEKFSSDVRMAFVRCFQCDASKIGCENRVIPSTIGCGKCIHVVVANGRQDDLQAGKHHVEHIAGKDDEEGDGGEEYRNQTPGHDLLQQGSFGK